MKRLFFIFIFILCLFISCGKYNTGNPISTQNYESSDLTNYKLTFLFEFEGIKFYKFYDQRRWRYFSIGNNGQYLNQIQTETYYDPALKIWETRNWNDGIINMEVKK